MSLAQLSPLAVPPVLEAGARTRRTALWLLLPLLGLLPALAVVYAFDPAQHGFYPRCLLHDWTGLQCSGCGSLRALHHLLHGHVGVAFASNALLVAWMPALAWETVRELAWKLRGATLPLPLRHPMWLWSFLASAVGFTVWRNVAPLLATSGT